MQRHVTTTAGRRHDFITAPTHPPLSSSGSGYQLIWITAEIYSKGHKTDTNPVSDTAMKKQEEGPKKWEKGLFG